MNRSLRFRGLGAVACLWGMAVPPAAAQGPSPAGGAAPARDAKLVCGPNSVYMLLKLFDIPVEREQVLKYMPNHPKGMSLLEMKLACGDFGLETEVRRCTKDDLRKIPYPVVAHVYYGPENEADHYVLITRRLDNDRLEVIDGTTGEVKVFFVERMSNIWQGLLLMPTRRPPDFWAAGGVALMAVPWLALGGYLLRRRHRRAPSPQG